MRSWLVLSWNNFIAEGSPNDFRWIGRIKWYVKHQPSYVVNVFFGGNSLRSFVGHPCDEWDQFGKGWQPENKESRDAWASLGHIDGRLPAPTSWPHRSNGTQAAATTSSTDDQGNGQCEAIWCGHTFHSHCLSEWSIVAMKGPMHCPSTEKGQTTSEGMRPHGVLKTTLPTGYHRLPLKAITGKVECPIDKILEQGYVPCGSQEWHSWQKMNA